MRVKYMRTRSLVGKSRKRAYMTPNQKRHGNNGRVKFM